MDTVYQTPPAARWTHRGAANDDDPEALQRAGHADDPSHPDKQQHAKDVLYTRQVHTQHCAQVGFLCTSRWEEHTGTVLYFACTGTHSADIDLSTFYDERKFFKAKTLDRSEKERIS